MLLRRVGNKPDRATLRLIVEALYPVVQQGREASRVIALEFYESERERVLGDPATTPVSMPHYEPHALRMGLDAAMRTTNAVSDASAMVVRHVEQAGRETIVNQTRADERARYWARRMTGRETCAFCRILVSRGPVYRSPDFQAHDRCDCTAVPVFRVDDWPGRAEYREALAEWKHATAGKSGADAINAYRREVDVTRRAARRTTRAA